MNPYEIAELESRELYCELCGEHISTDTYIKNEGLCSSCVEGE